jgi:hypothetical protein
MNTVKNLTGKLGNTLQRINKFEKTTTNPLRNDSSLSNKKIPKKQPQIKIVDLLKFELKKRSE